MRAAITSEELDRQAAEVLPAREALGGWNYAGIVANNQALAMNVGSHWSHANATAYQDIYVYQH
jgi:hypothetical protein